MQNVYKRNDENPKKLTRNENTLLHRQGHKLKEHINPLNKKHRLLYLKTQFVPRSKHCSSRI